MNRGKTKVRVVCPSCHASRMLFFRNRPSEIKCQSCAVRDVKAASDWCVTHGESKTPLYRVWSAMKSRCIITDQKYSPYYHKKGITVYAEWQEYIPFRDWALSHGYRKGLTIDRIDNDGTYCPRNCRWVTIAINNQNRPSTKLSVADACVIKDLHRLGVRNYLLAALYRVNNRTVSEITCGNNWKDCEERLSQLEAA